MKSQNKYAAELIGTFVLVFIGCGSAVIAGSQIGFLGISIAFGLSVLTMVYAIGPISGCHINPAITISMLVAGKINLKDTLGYIISQCIGATLAAFVLYQIATTHPDYSLAVNGIGQNGFDSLSPMNYPMAGGFLAEVVLTFIFLLVIFGATSPKADSKFAGIAIGLALAMIHMVGIPITGTSVNPARSLGPAVVMGGAALSQLWLFWIAPIIGGVLATLFYKVVLSEKS